MKKRKRPNTMVAVLCIPLSVIGLLFYLSTRDMSKEKGRELPPKPDYGKPEYRFQEKKSEPSEPKVEVEVPEVVRQDRMPSAPVEEEVVMPAPPVQEKKEPETSSRPHKHVQQIEGIPRCPECGSAISSYDVKCPNCGAQLK